MELNDILQAAVRAGASDVHLKAGLPPMVRIHGSLAPLPEAPRLPPEEVARMALGILNEYQREKFKQTSEVDLAHGVPGLGRFRVNVFQQRGSVGAVLRSIPFNVKSIGDLDLPKVLEKLALSSRGLVLVTGTTGSGKSTTLAAMVDHINTHETAHIMTIEDPIEFLIRDKRSVVNQREVGVDTVDFAHALKSALRQDPDVILVGEMRDLETIETALTAAETGHLVLSTLHTLDASETINRIISAFPPHQQKQIRLQLASVLKGIVSQRLIPRADGHGRVAAVEVLIATTRVRELIDDKDRTREIVDAISEGHQIYGMQTFDQSLMSLLKKGLISYEVAMRTASNPDDFALRYSGISSTSDSKWDDFESTALADDSVMEPPAPPQRAAPPPPVAGRRPTPQPFATPKAPSFSQSVPALDLSKGAPPRVPQPLAQPAGLGSMPPSFSQPLPVLDLSRPAPLPSHGGAFGRTAAPSAEPPKAPPPAVGLRAPPPPMQVGGGLPQRPMPVARHASTVPPPLPPGNVRPELQGVSKAGSSENESLLSETGEDGTFVIDRY